MNSSSTVTNPSVETVTTLTAKSHDPGEAAATIFKEQGLIDSLWQLGEYLLEALGIKEAKKIDDDYENISLDEIATRGNFPYRPSDLFLKV
jgi:hypothetical protein